MNKLNLLIGASFAVALVAAIVAALMGARPQDWQTQAESEHADWLDEMNTRESVRPQ